MQLLYEKPFTKSGNPSENAGNCHWLRTVTIAKQAGNQNMLLRDEENNTIIKAAIEN